MLDGFTCDWQPLSMGKYGGGRRNADYLKGIVGY